MELLELLGLARRNWVSLLLATAAGLGIAAAVSLMQPVLFRATSTGYVVAGSSESVSDAVIGKNLAADKAETYLPLVSSRSVAKAVADELAISSSEVLLTGTNEGVIFNVVATASSADLAREMADAGIRATSIAANQLETLTVSGASTGQTVVKIVPVELALTPTSPVSPRWGLNLALGLALGILGGFGFVVLRRTVDRRVRVTADVEELTGAVALGVVPSDPELAGMPSLNGRHTPAAEGLRKLRTNLRFVGVDKPLQSFVVTSANEGEGKSTIAANLAALLADSGRPTVLIDADMRRPRVATLFEMDNSVGLSQVLVGAADLPSSLIAVKDNLDLLPSGQTPPNPSELVGSDRMRLLIRELSKTRVVVIDAPPLLPVTDAALLSTGVDGALLVVGYGKTHKEHVALAARNIEEAGGRLLGFVLNQVPKKVAGAAAYGYGNAAVKSRYYQLDQSGLPPEVEKISTGKRAEPTPQVAMDSAVGYPTAAVQARRDADQPR